MNPAGRVRSIPDFDRIAKPYRWLEYLTFGRALERCRTHLLPHLLDRAQTRGLPLHRALVLGDGDGRFLAALLAAHPNLEADAVDTSAAMLHLLRRRAEAVTPPASCRLRTHHSCALAFTPERRCDLVATHFFLDCLTQAELDMLCRRLAPHLAPGALWLVSDFRVPPAGPVHWPARALVRALYLGFRLLTGLRVTALPDHGAALTTAGFARIAHHHSLGGLLTTELWQYDPAFSAPLEIPHRPEYTASMLPPQRPSLRSRAVDDPVPDPEPASPSLPGPDPGVFHRNPADDAADTSPDELEPPTQPAN